MADAAAVIGGIGQTEFSRSSTASSLELNLRAALAACNDAGIDPKSIDGIIAPSALGATVDDLCTALSVADLAYGVTLHAGGAGPAVAVGLACSAIRGKQCQRVLVSFGYNGYSETRLGYKPSPIMFGESPRLRRNYEAYNGLLLPAQYYALWATRYLYENRWPDTEALGVIAVNQRANAVRNDRAMMRTPITLEDHQASREITSPFRVLDCSLETDGAAAVVVMAEGLCGPDQNCPAAVGYGQAKPPSPDQSVTREPFLASAFKAAGGRAFEMAGLKPADIGFAELYDAFTFNVVWQLEALGFCDEGHARDFVLSGATSLDGELPVNTHGGLLSEGHLWGMNHITEAVRQLRATAGANQVRDAEFGLVSGTGDFGDAGVLILRARS